MSASVIHPDHLEWGVANEFHAPARRFAVALAASRNIDLQPLGRRLVEYLTQFDEAAHGQWAFFDDSVTDVLSDMDRFNKRDGCSCLKGSCPCKESVAHKTNKHAIQSIAETGGAVLIQRDSITHTQGMEQVFQVLLFDRAALELKDNSPFHLALNLERLSEDYAVRVIADSALEWAHGLPPEDDAS